MNFDWTEQERAFRAELVTFIQDNIRPGWTHHDRDMPAPGRP